MIRLMSWINARKKNVKGKNEKQIVKPSLKEIMGKFYLKGQKYFENLHYWHRNHLQILNSWKPYQLSKMRQKTDVNPFRLYLIPKVIAWFTPHTALFVSKENESILLTRITILFFLNLIKACYWNFHMSSTNWWDLQIQEKNVKNWKQNLMYLLMKISSFDWNKLIFDILYIHQPSNDNTICQW